MVAFLYDGRSWTFPLPLADEVADTRPFRIGFVVYAWLTLVIQTNKDLSKIMHLSIDVLFQFSNMCNSYGILWREVLFHGWTLLSALAADCH